MLLTAAQYASAEYYKQLLGLGDWDIHYIVSCESASELANVVTRPDYREAVICISLKELSEICKQGFNESVESLILHELGEIFVAECMDHLPDCVTDTDEMLRARDRIADKLRRTVRRMEAVCE